MRAVFQATQRRRAINSRKLALLGETLTQALYRRTRDLELVLLIADFLPDPVACSVFSGYRGGCVDTVCVKRHHVCFGCLVVLCLFA
jgi:hypothetical protein